MNKLYQQMTGNKSLSLLNNMKQIKSMFNTIKSMGNPQAMLTNAMQQNPELSKIVNDCNGDYQKAFYAYANKLGVNGDELLQVLK